MMERYNFKKFIDQIAPYDPGLAKDACASFIHESYSQYWRRYHVIDHVFACLREFENIAGFIKQGHAFECALWYHDTVYVPGSVYNEAMSADIAAFHCKLLFRYELFGSMVKTLIIDNRKHSKNDCDFFHDVDYSVFSKDNGTYLQYARNILAEFSFVADKHIFFKHRLKFLKTTLKRNVFRTEYYKDLHLRQAVENIREEIKMITKGYF